jgi:uncharacterized membrane protein
MSDLLLARVLHVLAVVLWIGGVSMVTTVLLPAVRRSAAPADRFATFDRMERRFAAQSRLTTAAAGLTGFYMTWKFDLWARFTEARFWWMHAMVAVWLVFTLMLFVLEPLVLHRLLERRAARDPEGTYRLVERLHVGLLAASLLTIAGVIAGVHGGWP